MGNKKIGLGLMLNLIGAMFAYLIGSGFASGQETMPNFSLVDSTLEMPILFVRFLLYLKT